VLVVPAGEWGPGLRWMEKLNFSFRTPTGTGGGASQAAQLSNPVAKALFLRNMHFDYRKRLEPYLRSLGVHTVLVEVSSPAWKQILDNALRVPARNEGGVWVYRI
jgi:hypothetical protein